MVRRLVIALVGLSLFGCTQEEGNAADMHLGAPEVKSKGQKNEQQARGMTEETTRGMGEGKLGHNR